MTVSVATTKTGGKTPILKLISLISKAIIPSSTNACIALMANRASISDAAPLIISRMASKLLLTDRMRKATTMVETMMAVGTHKDGIATASYR